MSPPEVGLDFLPAWEFLVNFPIEYARRHGVLVCKDAGAEDLICLRRNDTAPAVLDVVRRTLHRGLRIRALEKNALNCLTNRMYESLAERRATDAQTRSLTEVLAKNTVASGHADLLEEGSQGPIVQLVNDLLLEAIRVGASDVHLQPFEHQMAVRFRLDGVLIDAQVIDPGKRDEIISRLKIAGNMDIAEKRLPQDGRATVRVGDRVIDLRLASMPTSYGERMVVRLLDKSSRLYRLKEIGMDAVTLRRFRLAIESEHGLVLVTGPTGSGKSTTLYAALQELDTDSRNAVTLEDPIEYQLDGISQTQINTKKGMTFASGLRSVLRQDPDIIMLGEIRDQETAVMAIQSALTGHMVFSTLHTNDAASAVTRLSDLGIEPYLIASSLLAVLAQRLVRRICPACGGRSSSLTSKGISTCKTCRGTGYRGREGIYELLIVDDAVRGLIQRRAHAAEIRDVAQAAGMQLLRENGLAKALQGDTTVAEVERVTMRASQ